MNDIKPEEVIEHELRAWLSDYMDHVPTTGKISRRLASIVESNHTSKAEVDLRAALQRSMVAIDDWLNVYARDLCDPARIQEAEIRLSEHGTLSYIAQVQDQNRRALGLISSFSRRDGCALPETESVSHE